MLSFFLRLRIYNILFFSAANDPETVMDEECKNEEVTNQLYDGTGSIHPGYAEEITIETETEMQCENRHEEKEKEMEGEAQEMDKEMEDEEENEIGLEEDADDDIDYLGKISLLHRIKNILNVLMSAYFIFLLLLCCR